MSARSDRLSPWYPWLIFAITFTVFSKSLGCGLVNWDDLENVVSNAHLRGLTADNLRWMFTGARLGHYQPLTWLSYALDYAAWGQNPAGFHFTSVLLHSLNAMLVYRLARRLIDLARPEFAPRSALPALLGALLFALHPLRVESVTWVTERRDVLYGSFVFAAVLCHFRIDAGGGRWRIARDLLALCAGLSKSYLVTLPAVLILLDFWPLRRRTPDGRGLRAVLRDQALLLPMAVASAGAAIWAQRAGGVMQRHDSLTLAVRAVQAARGILFYLGKFAWPHPLSPLYELKPVNPVAPASLLAVAAVLALSALALAGARRRPACAIAWFIQLILLAPVLGFFQSGPQATADRYTYYAHLPFAVLLAGALAGVIEPRRRRALAAAGCAWLALLIPLTRMQQGVWRDSFTLWGHARRYDPASERIRRGWEASVQLAGHERRLAALQQLAAQRPLSAEEWAELGEIFHDFDRDPESLAALGEAIRLNPRLAPAYAARARIRAGSRLEHDLPGALADLDAALALEPGRLPWLKLRAAMRLKAGESEGALGDSLRVLAADPRDWLEQANAGLALARLGRFAEADAHYAQARAAAPPGMRAAVDKSRADAYRRAGREP